MISISILDKIEYHSLTVRLIVTAVALGDYGVLILKLNSKWYIDSNQAGKHRILLHQKKFVDFKDDRMCNETFLSTVSFV